MVLHVQDSGMHMLLPAGSAHNVLKLAKKREPLLIIEESSAKMTLYEKFNSPNSCKEIIGII